MNIKSLTTKAHQWEEIDSRVPPEYWPEYRTMSSVGKDIFKGGGRFTQED